MAEEQENVLYHKSSKTTVEWPIKDFINLHPGKGKVLESPPFYLSNVEWKMLLYPDGKIDGKDDYISLYLEKITRTNPLLVSYRLSIKVGLSVLKSLDDRQTFRNGGWGYEEFMKRSEILKHLNPELSDPLIIECSVENTTYRDLVHCRVSCSDKNIKTLTQNLGDIFLSHELSDVKFAVESKVYPAHKAILAARSPVFSAMFKHEMKENITGTIDITDYDPASVEIFLKFIYTGKVDDDKNISNIVNLYRIADKYELKDLKELCCVIMSDNLNVVHVCEVLKLAADYEENKLFDSAFEYFTSNFMDILVKKEWQEFNLKETSMANDILKNVALNALNKQKENVLPT